METKDWWEAVLCDVESILGQKLTTKLSLEKAPPEIIEKIRDVINGAQTKYVPSRRQGAAYLDMFNTRDLSAWLSQQFSRGPNPYKPLSEIATELCKYLMYYDSVAIKEPLITSLYEAKGRANSLNLSSVDATKRLGATVLQDGLRFWAEMRPLLRGGLIVPFPSHARIAVAKGAQCDELCSLDDQHPDVLDDAEAIIAAKLPEEPARLVHGLLGIAKGKDNVNRRFFNASILFCEEQRYQFVLQSLFGAALYVAKGKVAERVFKRLDLDIRQDLVLAACRLPSLEDLPLKELLDLHKDTDTFKLWRGQVSRIMADIDLESPESFSRAIDNSLPELSAQLTEKLSKYSLGKRLKKAAVGFGAGALGTFSTTGDPVTSILGGAASSGASLLMALLFEHPSKSDVALKRVYQIVSASEMGEIPLG